MFWYRLCKKKKKMCIKCSQIGIGKHKKESACWMRSKAKGGRQKVLNEKQHDHKPQMALACFQRINLAKTKPADNKSEKAMWRGVGEGRFRQKREH